MECIVCNEKVKKAEAVSCISVEKSDAKTEIHRMCQQCTKQYAKSMMYTGIISKGGTGLKCCAQNCANVIFLEPLTPILEESVKKRLDVRLADAALRGIENIEFCQYCNYGEEVDIKLSVERYFHCQNPECRAEFCRICGVKKSTHLEKNCEDVQGDAAKKQELEEQMSSSVIRRCPECSTQFQKETGCNRMTCANCGMTTCYLCGEAPITYEHFENSACKTWDDSELKDKNTLQEKWQEALLDENLREVAEKFKIEL